MGCNELRYYSHTSGLKIRAEALEQRRVAPNGPAIRYTADFFETLTEMV